MPTRVSIITPILNRRRFIEGCVESVLSEEDPAVEHVLVDGGSTDGTIEVLGRYASRYPERVRFVSEPDRGACDAWNKGWGLARGEILGWLGGDDLLEPGAVGAVRSFFDANPEARFVYGECRIIDGDGAEIGRFATNDFDRDAYLNEGNGIAAAAAYYRRSLVETVGPLDASIHLCDYDYWIRAGGRFRLHRIPRVLARYRIHAEGLTAALQNSVYVEESYRIHRRHGGRWWSPVVRRYLRYRLGRWLPRRVRRREVPLVRRAAIFGAALTGARCFEYLASRGVEVAFFIDSAPPPGGRFRGRPVHRPCGVPPEAVAGVEAIYVASAGRHAEMEAAARRAGLRLPLFRIHPDTYA